MCVCVVRLITFLTRPLLNLCFQKMRQQQLVMMICMLVSPAASAAKDVATEDVAAKDVAAAFPPPAAPPATENQLQHPFAPEVCGGNITCVDTDEGRVGCLLYCLTHTTAHL